MSTRLSKNEAAHNGLLFTATDTEVGKTWLMGAIAAILREDGYNVGLFKPVQSGHQVEDPEGDAMRLKTVSGVKDSPRTICPYDFVEPIAPLLAARRAGVEVQIATIENVWHELQEAYRCVFVEGAGGISVALNEQLTVADLAVRWKLPLIIIARAGLGTVNHTFLTVHYARSRGIHVLGVIVNGYDPKHESVSEKYNPQLIEDAAQVPVLGKVPWLNGKMGREELLQSVRKYVNLDPIRQYLQERSNKIS